MDFRCGLRWPNFVFFFSLKNSIEIINVLSMQKTNHLATWILHIKYPGLYFMWSTWQNLNYGSLCDWTSWIKKERLNEFISMRFGAGVFISITIFFRLSNDFLSHRDNGLCSTLGIALKCMYIINSICMAFYKTGM